MQELQEMWVQSLGHEDPLDEGMATHYSVLAWRSPRTEELGRPQSCPTLCDPTDLSRQVPLSMGYSRQEHCSGLPCPSPGARPNPGTEPASPALQVDSLPTEPWEKPKLNTTIALLGLSQWFSGFDPWVGTVHWRRKWQPTSVFLPEKSHRQWSLAGYSPWSDKEADMTEYEHSTII